MAGKLKTSVDANGTITNTYDQLERMISTVNTAGGGTEPYGYDAPSNLVTTGGTANNTYAYTYDARGNRLTAVVTGATPSSQTLTYNAANQITSTGYSYDGAGNLTAAPGATYTYNGAQQMTQAVTGGVTSTYTYAGAGQNQVLSESYSGRTYKITYGRTDSNGLPVIEGYNVNGNQAYLLSDPKTGQPIMLSTSADQDCLYVMDGIGNPVGLITDFALSSYTYTFDPYGAANLTAGGTGNGAAQNPYLFKSGIQDRATGLVKFGLRWYNPVTGTWTQQDTLDAPLDPANANRYAYAGGDPINSNDPGGLDATLGDYAGSCLVSGGVDVLVGLVGPDWTGVGLGAAFAIGCAQGVASTAIDEATDSYEGTDADIGATGIELGLNLAARFPL